MDLKNLNTFIQVAELGSFTKAAEQLGYAQPTISVQIRQLETELGVKLFERFGHTVRLTEAGRDVLSHSQQIMNMYRELIHSSQESAHPSVIRLATADSMCAPLFDREFAAFRAQHPHIRLKVTTAGTEEIFQLLDHNEVDMVCTLDSHIYNTSYVIAREEKVGAHFIAASSHPLSACGEADIRQLLAYPFLLTEKGMSYRRLLDEMLARNSLEIQPVLELGRPDVICSLVEMGMGISFLPDYVTEEAVRRGTVTRLTVPGYRPELWKQLLYHRDKWVSPQMQTVIDHFCKVLAQ